MAHVANFARRPVLSIRPLRGNQLSASAVNPCASRTPQHPAIGHGIAMGDTIRVSFAVTGLRSTSITRRIAMHPNFSARVALLVAFCSFSAPLSAQSAFVMIANGDTVQVERFTRTPLQLVGDVTPQGGLRQLFASPVDSAGHLGRLTLSMYSPGSAAAAQPMVSGDEAAASLRQRPSPGC